MTHQRGCHLSKGERIQEGHEPSEKNAMAALVGTHGHVSVSGHRVLDVSVTLVS